MAPGPIGADLESMGHDIANAFLHGTLRYRDSANRPPIEIASQLGVPSGLKELITFDSILLDSWFIACPFHLGFFLAILYSSRLCLSNRFASFSRTLCAVCALMSVSIKSLNIAHLPHKRSATRPLRLLLDIVDHVPTIMLILVLYVNGWNYEFFKTITM